MDIYIDHDHISKIEAIKSTREISSIRKNNFKMKTSIKECFSDKINTIIGDFNAPKKVKSNKKYDLEFNQNLNKFVSKRTNNSLIKICRPAKVLNDITLYS